TKDEFDLRVSEAFAARTCAGLRVLMADIPPGLARPQPGPIPQPGRPPAWRMTEQAAVRMIAAVLVAVPSTAFGVGLLESGTRPEPAVWRGVVGVGAPAGAEFPSPPALHHPVRRHRGRARRWSGDLPLVAG